MAISDLERGAFRAGASNWFLIEACRFPNCRLAAAIWLGQAIVVLALVSLFSAAPVWLVLSAFLAGMATWSPVEYILHRHVMHWIPLSPRLDRLVEKFFPHAFHHREPDNPGTVRRQQYPMAMIFLIFLGFSLVVPVAITAPFFAGIGVGYLLYELVHFAIHQCRMEGPVGRVLRQHHLFHHFRDDSVNFGLTSPVWDWVCGTLRRPAARRAG